MLLSRGWPKSITKVATPMVEQYSQNINKGAVAGFHPTTESNLRTALRVEICKLGIIARICKPLPDLCSEMGICSDVM